MSDADEKRVSIYDRKNPERYLGSIPRPSGTVNGRTYTFPVMTFPRELFPPTDEEPVLEDYKAPGFDRLDMHLSERLADGGWKRFVVFETNAPLSQLMLLQDFRLPRENKAAAKRRRYYSWY